MLPGLDEVEREPQRYESRGLQLWVRTWLNDIERISSAKTRRFVESV
jgi:hypothetical protein